MTKKQLQKAIDNLPKDKIIYQRYNGQIKSYIVRDKYYICRENSNMSINKDEKYF